MHVLFLAQRVPFPPNKGEKIRTFHQIQYLVERGHQVSVAAPLANDADRADLAALQQRYCPHAFGAQKPGRLSLGLGLLTGQPLSVSNFYTKKLQVMIDAFLISQRVDAVVCTSSSMAEYVFHSRVLSRQDERPVLVMDFMDLDSDKWRQYQRLNRFPLNLIYAREARLIAQYEQRIHRIFDSAIFISQSEVDLFLRSDKNLGKLYVLGNGLDTTTFRPSPHPKPQSGPVMLFTGVMDYLPNEDAVIWFVENAWHDIRARYPEAVFYIAGMNPSAKVAALSNYPGVVVTGYVDDIVEYYDKAHLFIAPFRIARGVQNKVLQALACGLPTITTSMGCEGIACENGQQLLVADTIADMIQQIDWVVKNPDEASRIGSNGAELMRREFSWSGKLEAFEEILSARRSVATCSTPAQA